LEPIEERGLPPDGARPPAGKTKSIEVLYAEGLVLFAKALIHPREGKEKR
jgi:hypothetical protein